MHIKRPMIFFAADAAVASPADNGTFDVASYVPTPVEEIDASLDRPDDLSPAPAQQETPPVEQPTPPEPKTNFPSLPKDKPQESPKPEQKANKPAAKPAPGAKKEPSPVEHLRTAYEESKTRLAEMEQELNTLRTNHPEVAQLRKDMEAERARIADFEKRERDYEMRLAAHDPRATRRFAELDKTFNETIGMEVAEMPKLQDQYNALVNKFRGLPPRGTPEFRQAFDEFEQQIVDEHGERRLDQVLRLVRAGAKYLDDRSSVERELREQGGKFLFEEQVKEYTAAAEEFQRDADAFLDVDPSIANSDPYNPVLFLQHCAKEDPEGFTKRKDQAVELARRAFLGFKPRTKDDFPGLDDKQIAETMAKEAQNAALARKVAARRLVQGHVAMEYLRAFLPRFKEMEARLAEQHSDLPPDEAGTAGEARPANAGVVDPSNYEPPAVLSEAEYGG